MASKTRVVFAARTKTADGKQHKAGSEATIEAGEARVLISRGIAKVAPEAKKPAASSQASK
jgi:hypothetical protein